MMLEKSARLVAYWLTVGMGVCFVAYVLAFSTKDGAKFLWKGGIVLENLQIEVNYFTSDMLFIMGPPIVVGMICHLLITSGPSLTAQQRLAYILRYLQKIRTFAPSTETTDHHKVNQWGMGDHGFYAIFFFFVDVPSTAFFTGGAYQSFANEADEPAQPGQHLYSISLYLGLGGSLAMSFFLIPVSRHNILLAAVGWSPIRALQLHILSGYLAYGMITAHGITYLVYMFEGYGPDGHERIIDQIIPDAHCWVWKPSEELYEKCYTQWWVITGTIAFAFMTLLVVTSLHWFRRKYYRLFYICHVIFGTLSIVFSIMHYDWLVIWMFPSLAYYVASTSTVLIQALASRFRGGVKITEVVCIPNSGECVEVKISSSNITNVALDREACMIVKMCVPSISLVWHPFTVYKHPQDSNSMRFIMRPNGPFTKSLASRLTTDRPIMILDGLYRGGNRIQEALCHDVVSIVSGGVALAPFLSMIPVLLQEIGKAGVQSVRTKKIVVHWSCREEGLISYIIAKYLNEFRRVALRIGFELTVAVYHTSVTDRKLDDSADSKKASADESAEGTIKNETSPESSDRTPSEDASTEINVGASNKQLGNSATTGGHCMEPARFMPALYPRIEDNLPQFVAMSSALWIAMVLFTHFMNTGHTRMKILHWLGAIWSTVLWVMVSICFGIGVEIFFVTMQNYLPQPQQETFVLSDYIGDVETGKSKNGHMSDADKITTAGAIEHRYRRPTAADVYAGLETSTCPAMFMCGPVGLTTMVREGARKENLQFGLTRYALYDEPFEM